MIREYTTTFCPTARNTSAGSGMEYSSKEIPENISAHVTTRRIPKRTVVKGNSLFWTEPNPSDVLRIKTEKRMVEMKKKTEPAKTAISWSEGKRL